MRRTSPTLKELKHYRIWKILRRVTIAGENSRSPRVFDERTSTILARSAIARRTPSLSWRHHFKSGLSTNHCWGCRRDHVHSLFALARTSALSEIVKEIKRGSSLWIKTKSKGLSDFAWQNGYGAFSIGSSQIEAVRRYIKNQEEHHRTASFQDEFRTLLRRYRIEFDERYVWD